MPHTSLLRPFIPQLNGSDRLVYLDSAATSLKPEVLLDAIRTAYVSDYAPVRRGLYRSSEIFSEKYEVARGYIAKRHNVSPDQVIFCSGTTDGLNRIALWARSWLTPDHSIAVGAAEHHSNLVSWYVAADQTGAALRNVSLNREFLYEPLSQDSLPTIFAVSLSSNVVGPVWKSLACAQSYLSNLQDQGVWTVVDGAQYEPFEATDLSQLGADFYLYSAHKMLGPMGLGVLILSSRAAKIFKTPILGGGAFSEVLDRTFTFAHGAAAYEPGTPPAVQAIAFAETLKWLTETLGIDEHKERVRMAGLLGEVCREVESLGGYLLGNSALRKEQGHLVSFRFDDIHPHDLARLLSESNICVRAGYHCAQPLHNKYLGGATVRVSLHWYTDDSDIEQFVVGLRKAVDWIRGGK